MRFLYSAVLLTNFCFDENNAVFISYVRNRVHEKRYDGFGKKHPYRIGYKPDHYRKQQTPSSYHKSGQDNKAFPNQIKHQNRDTNKSLTGKDSRWC